MKDTMLPGATTVYPLIHTGTVAVNHLIRTLTANHVVRSETVSMSRLIWPRESLSLFRYGSGISCSCYRTGLSSLFREGSSHPSSRDSIFAVAMGTDLRPTLTVYGHGPRLWSTDTHTDYGCDYCPWVRLWSTDTVCGCIYGL